MGTIYADLHLLNTRRPELQPITVRAMADTGAVLTCIPKSVAMQLQVDIDGASRRPTTFADGSTKMIPYVGPLRFFFKNRAGCPAACRSAPAHVGPLRFFFKNRESFGGALVMGDEVLLWSVQMEDMDVLLFPKERKIDVNPSSPNFPHMIVK